VYGSVRGYTGPPEGVKVWWNCTVDGVQQIPDPHPTVDENYHRLCYNSALDWRDHTLVIQVTSKDKEPFYFDTVDYSSGINETKTNRRSIVTIADEELFFSPGSWGNLGIYKTTNAKGGNLRFPFDGKYLALVIFHAKHHFCDHRRFCCMVWGLHIRDKSSPIIRYLVCRW